MRRGVSSSTRISCATSASVPWRSSYDHSGLEDPAALRRKIQAGPPRSGATPTSCPSSGARRPPLDAGFTPLIRSERLAERLGLGEVYVKNDAANPTHSFKDRVVSVAVAKAKELGLRGGRLRLDREPRQRRRSSLGRGGAGVIRLRPRRPGGAEDPRHGRLRHPPRRGRGNYDDVNRLCTELSAEHPWAFVNVNLRPYYAEGSKTLAFEVAEQLGFELPDRVVCPVASGRCSPRSPAGFEEWLELGLLEGTLRPSTARRPRAAARWPQAFEAGHDICRPVRPDTIAQVAGDRQPGGRCLRAGRGPPDRRHDRLRDRR